MIILRDLILTGILITICYTDIKRMEIDNEPILLGLAFAIPFSMAGLNAVTTLSSIYGFLLGGIIFAILTIWGMGGGDVKLMAMIGFFLGWQQILAVTLLSFIIGSVLGIFYVFVCKKSFKTYIPFGPSIAVATIITILFGSVV